METPVTINGWTLGDAMEPFISPDGQYLIWNSENNGIDTKLYYGTRVNDTTWNFVGEVVGVNQIAGSQLNAVPDLDSNGIFIWTSARGYPQETNNLWMGEFSSGTVSNIRRVRGDFYKDSQYGWIEMDHGISLDGQILVTNNARFAGSRCNGPCDTEMGLAQKVNDSTFLTLANSQSIMANINQSNYVYYAPYITPDLLELYWTRIPDTITSPNDIGEIMVATRQNTSSPFGQPHVLFTSNIMLDFNEAPCLTTDKQKMYYHRKINDTFEIYMRHRMMLLPTESGSKQSSIKIFPNPAKDYLQIQYLKSWEAGTLIIYNSQGREIKRVKIQSEDQRINTSDLVPGNYKLIILESDQAIHNASFIIHN